MDIVFIHNLDVDTVIGVYDWERSIRQTLRFDLEMATDIARAAQSDDLAHALDYKAVADRITEFVSACDYLLIERVAEEVAQLVMAEFGVAWLRLKLAKPTALLGDTNVGLIIERGKRPESS